MSTSDDARGTAFMRGAAAIGDLDSPVYQEERSRDVWNEAMAVAFQLATVLALLASAGMLWIVGRSAIPYVWAVLWVVALPVFVAIGYAHRLGVDAPGFSDLGRIRMVIVGVLTVLNLGGLLWAYRDVDGESLLGMLVGGGAAVATMAAIAVFVAWRRRRASA